MAVSDRLIEMIDLLKKADKPVSGTALAKEYGVSRQIIVKDIERLRDSGINIYSTPRGYVIDRNDEISRVFKVFHAIDDTEQELNLIVDLGAEVRDVFIYHKVYGEIRAKLNIRSRRDARNFCNDIESGKSSPLMTATGGYHYHTVIAEDIETLDLVEAALRENNLLAELTNYEPESIVEQNQSQGKAKS